MISRTPRTSLLVPPYLAPLTSHPRTLAPRISRKKGWGPLLLSLLLLLSCTANNYDSGDGPYSTYTSEFGEAVIESDGTIHSVLTDADARLTLTTPVTPGWQTESGKTERVRFQYFAPAQSTADGPASVKPYSISQVPVLPPADLSAIADPHTDPLTLESAWKSQNGRYLNLRVVMKTGMQGDEYIPQKFTMATERTETASDGSQTIVLRLLHDQNGAPQYYSQTLFISIPLANYRAGDTLLLNVNTYQGEVQKSFVL